MPLRCTYTLVQVWESSAYLLFQVSKAGQSFLQIWVANQILYVYTLSC